MSAIDFSDLKRHRGHTIELVRYGDSDSPQNVALECVDCGEVLFDRDRGTLGYNELSRHLHSSDDLKVSLSGKPPHTAYIKCPFCREVMLKFQRVKVIVEDGRAECTVCPPEIEFQLVDRDGDGSG